MKAITRYVAALALSACAVISVPTEAHACGDVYGQVSESTRAQRATWRAIMQLGVDGEKVEDVQVVLASKDSGSATAKLKGSAQNLRFSLQKKDGEWRAVLA